MPFQTKARAPIAAARFRAGLTPVGGVLGTAVERVEPLPLVRVPPRLLLSLRLVRTGSSRRWKRSRILPRNGRWNLLSYTMLDASSTPLRGSRKRIELVCRTVLNLRYRKRRPRHPIQV